MALAEALRRTWAASATHQGADPGEVSDSGGAGGAGGSLEGMRHPSSLGTAGAGAVGGGVGGGGGIWDAGGAVGAFTLAGGFLWWVGDGGGWGGGAKILGFRVLQVAGTTHERYAGKFAEAVNAWREENRDVNKVGEEEELKIAIAVGVAETARQCPWRVMEVSE